MIYILIVMNYYYTQVSWYNNFMVFPIISKKTVVLICPKALYYHKSFPEIWYSHSICPQAWLFHGILIYIMLLNDIIHVTWYLPGFKELWRKPWYYHVKTTRFYYGIMSKNMVILRCCCEVCYFEVLLWGYCVSLMLYNWLLIRIQDQRFRV